MAQVNEATYAHIERVLSNFDFEKVEKMMKAVDWKWRGPIMNGEFEVPTVEQMRSQAGRLMYIAINRGFDVSRGGFEAYWIREGETPGYRGEGCVGLRFIADYGY
jgi:hypothetical protein